LIDNLHFAKKKSKEIISNKPATTPAEKIKSGGAKAASNSTPRNHQTLKSLLLV